MAEIGSGVTPAKRRGAPPEQSHFARDKKAARAKAKAAAQPQTLAVPQFSAAWKDCHDKQMQLRMVSDAFLSALRQVEGRQKKTPPSEMSKLALRAFDGRMPPLPVKVDDLAKEVGLTRFQVIQKLHRLAYMAWLNMWSQRRLVTDAFEQASVRDRRVKIENITENESYDGTPLDVRQRAPKPKAPSAPSAEYAPLTLAVRVEKPKILSLLLPLKLGNRNIVAPTKLFQVRSEWGLIASFTPEGQDPRFIVIAGVTTTLLQGLSDESAPSIYKGLANIDASVPSDARAETRTRAATKDRHPSNPCAERKMCTERNGNWDSIEIDCENHMAQSVHKSVAVHLKVVVSTGLHTSLMLHMASEINEFRQCVFDTARGIARIHSGACSEDATRRRMLSLKTWIVNTKSANLKIALFLATLPAGVGLTPMKLSSGYLLVQRSKTKKPFWIRAVKISVGALSRTGLTSTQFQDGMGPRNPHANMVCLTRYTVSIAPA